ncbi:Helix-turn-helix domain-containing protein [Sinosporangium album]|uniref:Helix-turn-helix domain-containing protein n=1 Tax=Sinosporangium album TaxID=504805 RepID=A0A1G7WPD3_9ACTN|nr:helix-turn-helix transcriptional regulator [Sinosporangium album]SDG73789.1 Helix-turn-helix domain-containing protein [Sinosporangium album]
MAQSEAVEQFAARLRMLKERSGMSFEALAGRTGISGSSLHRYCSGIKLPVGFGAVHSFAKACGATAEELRDLHRLWALADADRSLPPRNAGDDAGPPGPVAPPTGDKTAVRRPLARQGARTWVPAASGAVLLGVAAFVGVLRWGGHDPMPAPPGTAPGATPTTSPIRVFNTEYGCRHGAGRLPACSLGLARDPRLRYDVANVVEHRVWHGDLLRTDCVFYGGWRVLDEAGVSSTRWYRVRLPGAGGGVAWLPGVRTKDTMKLPACR